MAVLSSKHVLQEQNTKDPNTITSLTLTYKALTDVLNAGKNKIKSVNEVRSLVRLRALILNVLSKNPIHKIGESLALVESITKLSLSHCKLQAIDFSLRSCTELKELRLAHNEIMCLPGELVHNVKLQNLDLGNNLITRKSDLTVLASLVNLRNLNLQGNPIAEKGKLPEKIKQLVPNLQIYNAKPIDKKMKNKTRGEVDVSSLDSGKVPVVRKEEQTDDDLKNKSLKHDAENQSKDYQLDNAGDVDIDTELKLTKQKRKEVSKEKASNSKESKEKKKVKLAQENPNEGSKVKPLEELDTKPKKKAKQTVVSVIDDGETPFTDILDADTAENAKSSGRNKTNDKTKDPKMADVVVTFPKKKKYKNWITGSAALQELAPTTEVGLGGTSTWDY